MILAIVVLLLLLAIGFFHWMQGLLSATISAIAATLAAAVALGYHETLVFAVLGGKFADQANAIALVSIFAMTYIVIRLLADKLVPGNLRFPNLVDKIGGAALGAVAGCMALGVVVVAAQSLPLGPSLGGYSRYAMDEGKTGLVIPGASGGANKDARVEPMLEKATLDEPAKLLLPVDDLVVGLTAHLSETGSLRGSVPFSSVHPDYLQELFGQRIGIQVGARRTAINRGDDAQVRLSKDGKEKPVVYRLTTPVPQRDDALAAIRKRTLAPLRPATAGKTLVVVRAWVQLNATDDKDKLFRFSPGSVRLVAPADAEGTKWTNYFPIGTMERSTVLYANMPDDFLFLQISNEVGKDWTGVDLVFEVDAPAIKAGAKDGQKEGPGKFADGSFLEVKRMARVSLEDVDVAPVPAAWDPRVAVVRKVLDGTKPTTAPSGQESGGGTPAVAEKTGAPFAYVSVNAKAKALPVAVNHGLTGTTGDIAGRFGGSLRDGRYEVLAVDVKEPLSALQAGGSASLTGNLFVPSGQALVAVSVSPVEAGWRWAEQFSVVNVVDSGGRKHEVVGLFARVQEGGADKVFAYYNASGGLSAPEKQSGTPTGLVYYFLVPTGTKLQSITFEGKVVAPFGNVTAGR